MGRKLSLLIGFGAGYVLGARAGRERYDQIAGKAQELWRNPRVQEKAGQAQHLAQDKASQAAEAVKDTVTEKVASATSHGEGTDGQAGTGGEGPR